MPADATGKGILVGVLDSGVDDDHPQLQGQVADFIDPLKHQSKVDDLCGHGTAVAGLIAGKKRNDVAFRGLAFDAKILSARVSEQVPGHDDEAPVTDAEMAAAVRWAVDKGAKVINISFVYVSAVGRDLFKKAIEDAISRDVVIVAAVGNNNTAERKNPTPYPAAWPGVVGVAAIASNGDLLPASGVGDFVDIAAPGKDVLVPKPIGGYGFDAGTSFASPLVAATAALIFQRFPGIKAKEVIRRLLATADPAPGGRRSEGYGAGLLNPVRAVTEVIDDAAPARARALQAPTIDPVQARAAAEEARIREQALWFSAIGIVAALLAVALMVALPAGIRRKWRPAGER
ncbi:type VII secretion-associated serine protease [Rhizocola hellebori]|uniref:Type VII secretion-associated serine protease n=2 Tax=Rhizocola hellebori TaxID=1392758 RepID=A0A8J3QHX7_9ACTN|nr:type VII secretion-associated serine protease [Rhizocola hellebori]